MNKDNEAHILQTTQPNKATNSELTKIFKSKQKNLALAKEILSNKTKNAECPESTLQLIRNKSIGKIQNIRYMAHKQISHILENDRDRMKYTLIFIAFFVAMAIALFIKIKMIH